MFLQIDMIDAQINPDAPRGSVEIYGQTGYIRLEAKYAEKIKAKYKDFLKAYPQKESLKITLNIEVPQPIGQWVNEG
jgi:hypothetical protein